MVDRVCCRYDVISFDNKENEINMSPYSVTVNLLRLYQRFP